MYWGISLTCADFDQDSQLDLVVTHPTDGWLTVFLNRTNTSEQFRRGDVDFDEIITIGDSIAILWHLFSGQSPELSCPDGADANDDGAVDLTDSIVILNFLFVENSPPIAPPNTGDCGEDPTEDSLPQCVLPPGTCP